VASTTASNATITTSGPNLIRFPEDRLFIFNQPSFCAMTNMISRRLAQNDILGIDHGPRHDGYLLHATEKELMANREQVQSPDHSVNLIL
jgi:hypothetical protein